MEQGRSIQDSLHGQFKRITIMKAPLTPIFIKEGGERWT
jgi:hypothetical protein